MSEFEPLLVLEDLCIRTPERTLVDGVSFTAHRGRITAVVGKSGSGKSLSARAAMGVLDVDPGLVRGSLKYPGTSGDKDWFAGVHNQGMKAQMKLLKQSRHLRGGYITYSPQSASSALNPGRTIGRQLQMAIERRDVQPANLGCGYQSGVGRSWASKPSGLRTAARVVGRHGPACRGRLGDCAHPTGIDCR